MNHIFRTSSHAFLLRASGTGVSFLFNVLLARLLGAEGAGAYYLAASVVSVTTISCRLGLDNTLLRFVSTANTENDWDTIQALYRRGCAVTALVAAVFSGSLFLLAPVLSKSVFSDPALATPFAVLSLSILPQSLVHLHAELLKAIRKTKLAMLLQGLLVPLFSTCLLLVLAPAYGVAGVVYGVLVAASGSLLIAALYWKKMTPAAQSSESKITNRQLLQTSLPLFIIGIMNVLIDFTDTMMIGYFLETKAVGLYTIPLRVTALCSLLLTAVNSTIAPEFSSLWSNKDTEQLESIAQKTTRAMALISSALFIFFLLVPEAILSIFGAEFREAAPVLCVLACGQWVALGTGPVAYLLMMTGHEKFHRNNVFMSAVLNIILNVVLIPRYGILGAAIATATSLSVKNVLAVLYVRKKLSIKVLC